MSEVWPRQEKSVDTIHSIMLRKMVGENKELATKSKVDISGLPPCRDSLVPHIARVNYHLAYYSIVQK